jgi:Domain of unknown function (DUF397)
VQAFGLFVFNRRSASATEQKNRGEVTMSDDKFAGWRKSSYSGDGNSCVELAATRPSAGAAGPAVGVRDTKANGRGPVLEFGADTWREFLSRIK